MERVKAPIRPVRRAAGASAAPAAPTHPVLQLQRAAGNRATTALIQRQVPTTAPAPAKPRLGSSRLLEGHPNTIIIDVSDGSHYRVTRTPDPSKAKPAKGEPTRIRTAHDADRVWLALTWCKGERGEIKIGGNPQGAARKLLEEIGKAITAGGGPNEVAAKLKAAEFEPFAEVDIVRAGDWRISGGVTLTVDPSGLKAGKGRVEVQKGPVSGGIEVSKGGDDPGTITITGTYKGSPPDAKKCEVGELIIPWKYECRHERHIPDHFVSRIKPVHKSEQSTRFLYFRYREDVLEQKLPKIKELNDKELELLKGQLAADWSVIGVEAHTSPEGPREAAAGFQGNNALAGERGQAAVRLAQAAAGAPDKVRGGVTVTPSELLDTGVDPEDRGRKLEENVVKEFLKSKDEERHRTPDVLTAIEKARGTAAKAQVIYPFLRRAEVKLERRWTEDTIEDVLVDEEDRSDVVACSEEIMDRTRIHWAVLDFKLPKP
jgi:hypothetical protein